MILRASPDQGAVGWSPGTDMRVGCGEGASLWIGTSREYGMSVRIALRNSASGELTHQKWGEATTDR